MVDAPRLRQHVWTRGREDGRPLLSVHGNIATGGFWRYVAERLPSDVRVVATPHVVAAEIERTMTDA